MLDVDIAGHRGDFSYAAAFKNEGKVTALFGASGAGKTTIINALSGVVTPTNGFIRIKGDTVFDTIKRKNIKIRRRKVAQIFQDARLFPHFSVERNLTYARWAGGRKKTADFDKIVELLGLGDLLKRKPETLSGGEQQRVAIGRALLSDPRLLLLDEPLSGLDQKRKNEIMPYFDDLATKSGIPMVYVSHDINEVIRLADHLVLLEQGRVKLSGPIGDVLPQMHGSFDGLDQAPTSLINAVYQAIEEEDQMTRLTVGTQSLYLPKVLEDRKEPYRIRIDARDVSLALEEPTNTSVQNVLRGRILEIRAASDVLHDVTINVEGRIIVSRITKRALRTLDLKIDQQVYAMVKSAAVEGLA